ncbi:MAG: hypothetical protein NUV73_01100, partial [Candidatus Daviesbacteria bacterium]|nr:hypothetical protein [Candidatus Daviesbacteria bacterium]
MRSKETPEVNPEPTEGPIDEGRRKFTVGCLAGGALWATAVLGGPAALGFLGRFRISYDPGPAEHKQLEVIN